MKFPLILVPAVSALVKGASLLSTSVARTSSSLTVTAPAVATQTSANPTTTSPEPCGVVSALASAYFVANPEAEDAYIKPSIAFDCLKSVPLDKDRSKGLVEWALPFVQFTSTLPYLKDPPPGWTMPGVDILGGLTTISANIDSGVYENQYAFEKDLFALLNVVPRDFHMNLDMPLVNGIFNFVRYKSLLFSLSSDGQALPQVYWWADLQQEARYGPFAHWTPSPIVAIDGQAVASAILSQAMDTQPYLDADSIFNNMLYSAASASQAADSTERWEYPIYGLDQDNTTYVFANGSSFVASNYAIVLKSFKGITSGQDLFDAYEIPPTEDTSSVSSAAPSVTSPIATSTSTPITTSLVGYPTPIVMHPAGYVSGYYLTNSSTIAVLAINAFTNDENENDLTADGFLQAKISKFLTACKLAGKTKLIVDVRANGGGSVATGFDAFKQLFPSLDPFGATRLRSTPLAQYFGEVFSTAGIYTSDINSLYQTQASVNVNGTDFANYQALVGPETLYGDNFTALLRQNLSDPLAFVDNIAISGYGNRSNIPASPFTSENIVLLHDGLCGSTCAVFAELMKSQGGVRSIAVGGRSQYGPMQGVAGSKGAQVNTYENFFEYELDFPELANAYTKKGQTMPPLAVPAQYNITKNVPINLLGSARVNVRNNFHSADPSEVPLQFIYEAANCRLFNTIDDIVEVEPVWQRVAEVAWGSGKCVQGSSINADNSFPQGAYDTVSQPTNAKSQVGMTWTVPGVLTAAGGAGNSSNGTSNGTSNGPSTVSSTTSPTSSVVQTNVASTSSVSLASLFVALGALLMF